jgi:hypothetical protein
MGLHASHRQYAIDAKSDGAANIVLKTVTD